MLEDIQIKDMMNEAKMFEKDKKGNGTQSGKKFHPVEHEKMLYNVSLFLVKLIYPQFLRQFRYKDHMQENTCMKANCNVSVVTGQI